MGVNRFCLTAAAAVLVSLAHTTLVWAACNPNTHAGCVMTGDVESATGPAPGEQYTTIAQGLFAYTKTDLTVGGSMPIEVTRVYRSEDRDDNGNVISGDFGVGTRLSYDIFLYSNSEVANGTLMDANVVMPDGGQINCRRITSCSGNAQCSDPSLAEFTCDSQPVGAWFGADISYNATTQGFDLTRKDGMVYRFGHGAPLQRIIDSHFPGNQIAITHSAGQTGMITRINSSTGRYVTFTPNGGVISRATDSSGRYVDYGYDTGDSGAQKLTSVTYTRIDDKAKIAYGWGDSSTGTGPDITTVVINVKNPSSGLVQNWNYITYGTGAQHKLASVSSQLPQSGYQYEYDTPGNGQVKVTLPDGSMRVFTFNAAGYLTMDQRAYNTSLEEDTTYNRKSSNNLITAVISPLTSTTTRTTGYTYDTLGNVNTVSHRPGPAGGTTSVTTAYSYEPPYNPNDTCPTFSRILSVKEPLTPPTTYSYSSCIASPPTETVTDPVGRVTTITRSASTGQVLSVQDPLSNVTSYTYDAPSGDPATATDPVGNQTTYNTDTLGRVTFVQSPMLKGTSYGHNYTYDDMDDVTSVIDPNGNTQSYQYDFVGNVILATDPRGFQTTIDITGTLDKTTTCDALGNCSVEQRDTNGRRSNFTDKRGLKTVYHYDQLSRVTQVEFNNNNLHPYDQRTINFGYDFADRLIGVGDIINGGTPTHLVYQYGGLDNITEEDTAEGSIINGYDDNGRRISMQSTFHGTTLPGVSFSYYDDDQIKIVRSGALAAAFVYDGDGRRSLKKVSGATPNIVSTAYAYDSDSRVCAIYYGDPSTPLSNPACDGVTGGPIFGNLTYTYDQDSRVVAVYGQQFAGANLHAPTTATATYGQTEQILSWNGVTAQSDDASNLTRDPSSSKTYAWDSRNQLSQVSPGPNGNLQMTYDALGRRRLKSSQSTNLTTSYLYDGGAPIAASSTGLPTANWTMRGPGGEIFVYQDTSSLSPGSWVPLQDASGSTIAMVDSTGAVSTQYTYDANGNAASNGSNSMPYLFRGMELDSESGLYHAGTQYYSPQLTRPLAQIGPTGAAGSGSSGSPAGVAGFAGGANSFSATDALADLGIGDGAGAGAAAITAGAIKLFAIDVSAIAVGGAVGIVVATAVDLAVLIDDLLGGGSPGPPWEVHAAWHTLLGMKKHAGEVDVVDQSKARLQRVGSQGPGDLEWCIKRCEELALTRGIGKKKAPDQSMWFYRCLGQCMGTGDFPEWRPYFPPPPESDNEGGCDSCKKISPWEILPFVLLPFPGNPLYGGI